MVSKCENKQTGNMALMKSRKPNVLLNRGALPTCNIYARSHTLYYTVLLYSMNTSKHAATLETTECLYACSRPLQCYMMSIVRWSSSLVSRLQSHGLVARYSLKSAGSKGSGYTQGNLGELYITQCSSTWNCIKALRTSTTALPRQ